MSDPGCVERNVRMNQIALDRARLRNGNNGVIPDYAPSSVTGADMTPSRAVDKPEPYVGTNGGE